MNSTAASVQVVPGRLLFLLLQALLGLPVASLLLEHTPLLLELLVLSLQVLLHLFVTPLKLQGDTRDKGLISTLDFLTLNGSPGQSISLWRISYVCPLFFGVLSESTLRVNTLGLGVSHYKILLSVAQNVFIQCFVQMDFQANQSMQHE